MLIGEEVTYRLNATFFGADSDITGITLNDTPADSNTSAHNGLAYVSHTFTTSNEIVPSVTAPTPVAVPATPAQSRVSFTSGTLSAPPSPPAPTPSRWTSPSASSTSPPTTDAKALRNNLGLGFTYLGQFFRSNDTDDDGSLAAPPLPSFTNKPTSPSSARVSPSPKPPATSPVPEPSPPTPPARPAT